MRNDFGHIVRRALQEDACRNDITSRILIPVAARTRAVIIAKEPAVICGIELMKEVFLALDRRVQVRSSVKDGQKVAKGQRIAEIRGPARSVLAGERAALNFLGYLSGISTQTQAYVRKVRPFKARILDTRKTTPGLRELEKFAVRCGGGTNHRQDLGDMVLIKDNHRVMTRRSLSIPAAIAMARRKTAKQIEIEVDDLVQLEQALGARPDIILLDNMRPAQLKAAVRMRDRMNPKGLLEASGGITLQNVHAVARTGVDRISVGALTHSPQNIDLSLEFIDAHPS